MNESGIGQVAQTVANTLADERATHTVHFPLTGVLEADLISGVSAIVRAVKNPTMDQNRAIMRVLQMLAAEYEDIVKESDRLRDIQSRYMGQWSGSSSGGLGHYTGGGTGLYPGSPMQAVQPMQQQSAEQQSAGLTQLAPKYAIDRSSVVPGISQEMYNELFRPGKVQRDGSNQKAP